MLIGCIEIPLFFSLCYKWSETRCLSVNSLWAVVFRNCKVQ